MVGFWNLGLRMIPNDRARSGRRPRRDVGLNKFLWQGGPNVGKHILKFRNGPGEQMNFSLKFWELLAEIPRGTERRPRPIIWYHSQP